MKPQPFPPFRIVPHALRAVLLACACLWAIPGHAQDSGILQPGDAVVTGFSGTVSQTPPTGTDPLDTTFIDIQGVSARIKQLQPAAPPQGQLVEAAEVLDAKAGSIGQVFAIALDDALAPDIYLAASSAYGIHVVHDLPDGSTVRLKTGAPDARFMDGQWGTGLDGGPGSIYRIDGMTGEISLFTTIGANTGAALGDIVFDRITRQFFVSDLDTGLIYRLDDTGLIIDVYDHGATALPASGAPAVPDDASVMDITDPAFDTQDPATWGLSPKTRRVRGLALHNGRLYYAVADGPQVWSVGINLDGSFAGDPRWELDVADTPADDEVASIAFDNQGRMILAQRGAQRGSYDDMVFAEPKTAAVLRYAREVPDDPTTPGTWREVPDRYDIGFRPDGHNATGGAALGYGYDSHGRIEPGTCGAFLWTSGDSLRDDPALAERLGDPAVVHGLQGNDAGSVIPANQPPFHAYFVDYDNRFGDADNQGHAGDVAVFAPCGTGSGDYGYLPPASGGLPGDLGGYYGGEPPPGFVPPPGGTPPGGPGTFDLSLSKTAPRDCAPDGDGWMCDFTIRVTNAGTSAYAGTPSVEDFVAPFGVGAHSAFASQPPWACAATSWGTVKCVHDWTVLFPGESVDLHQRVRLDDTPDRCFMGNGARLVWPWGGDADPSNDYGFASAATPSDGCTPPPDGAGSNLGLWKRATPQTCVRDGEDWLCTFALMLTNTGPDAYRGPVTITDTLDRPGVSFSVTAGDIGCTLSGTDLTCSAPWLELAAGDSIWFNAALRLDPDTVSAGGCRVRNTARIAAPAGGSAGNANADDDQDSDVAEIPEDACTTPGTPPHTDLSIDKTATGCQTLDVDGPMAGRKVCSFKVTLTNQGPAPFDGPVSVHDSADLPLTSDNFYTSGQVACSPAGDGMDCQSTTDVHLAPGDQAFGGFFVLMPQDGGPCTLTNTIALTSPAGGSAQNSDAGNDTSSATDTLPDALCSGTQPEQIELSLDKTFTGCTAESVNEATYQTCMFDVRITNNGTTTYDGQLAFSDDLTPSLPAGSSLVGATASCAANGAGGITCTSDPLSLPPGDNWQLTLGIRVPADGSVCSFTNQAAIVTPSAGTPSNATADDDVDSVTFDIPGQDCGQQPPPQTQSDLSVEKTLDGCAPADTGDDSGDWICRFDVVVRNNGPDAYEGVVAFTDATSPALPPSAISDDTGACVAAPGSGVVCTSQGPVSLLPYVGYWTHSVAVTVPAATGVCEVHNAATLITPESGATGNTDPDNDTAAATGEIPLAACSSGPQVTEPEQSDLSLVKDTNGNGGCVIVNTLGEDAAYYTGRGVDPEDQICTYIIAVTNEGPATFHGPVVVHDAVDGAFPIVVSVGTEDLEAGDDGVEDVCTQSPTSGYDCALNGPVTLDPGQILGFAVVVDVPSDPGTCQMTGVENAATLTTPPGGDVTNSNPDNDADSAVQALVTDNPACRAEIQKSEPPKAGGNKACTPIRTRPDGSCCPAGQIWNGRQCGQPGKAHPQASPKPRKPAPSTQAPPVRTKPAKPNRTSRPRTQPCPKGTVGTYPNCRKKPSNRQLNPGDVFQRLVPQILKGPTQKPRPRTQSCPKGTVGIYPNCRKAPRNSGTQGGKKTPTRCPKGTIGTYPNCIKQSPLY